MGLDVDALKELLEQRFDAQDRMLNRIEVQTTKTNGRVSVLEQQMAGALPRIAASERSLERKATPSGDGRKLTKWDAALVVGTVVACWSIAKALGLIR